jgi:hypothetical protein
MSELASSSAASAEASAAATEAPIILVVGSTNPVKVASSVSGMSQALKNDNIQVKAINVPSGVSNQPFSDEETKTGAINRAMNAWTTYIESSRKAKAVTSASDAVPEPHYSLGGTALADIEIAS